MNVLSLFDGIACGRVALERAGIKVDNYFASEIDKYAIQIAQKNYPDIIQLGDVKDIGVLPYTKYLDLPDREAESIDLLIGGSPCQGFSFAGKQLNFEDPRSKLFFEFVRILKEVKPKYFLLENVRMKQEYQDIISEQLGVKPIMINSSLVSAQNRVRLYWTNIPNITQPKDKGIYLKDIIQDGVPFTDKAYCLKVGGREALTLKGLETYLSKKKDNFIMKDKPERIGHFNSGGQGDRVYSINGKSVALSALGGGRGAKTGLYLIVPEATKKGYVEIKNGECVDLTYIGSKTRRGRRMEDKCNCLTASNYNYCLFINNAVRKLTPIECERLQTLPDNFTEGISNGQRYKALGNGWTVDVLAHIFKNIK